MEHYWKQMPEELKTKVKVEVFLNLIADGIPKSKAQRLAAIDDELVEKALKSREK